MSDDYKPFVSILVPVYNCEKYIAKTLDSALNQTHKDIEIIVVDDGSTDGTREIVQEYMDKYEPIFLLKPPFKVGCGGGRNYAYHYSCGDYIATLDADDLWHPTKLEKQLAAFTKPEIGLVYTWSYHIDEEGDYLPNFDLPSYSGDVLENICYKSFIGAGSVPMIRRDVFEHIGLYDGQFFCEDWDMYVRIAQQYEFAYVAEPLVEYRQLKTSMSKDYSKLIAGFHYVQSKIELQGLANPLTLRKARARFYWYMAVKHYEGGKYSEALRFISLSLLQGTDEARHKAPQLVAKCLAHRPHKYQPIPIDRDKADIQLHKQLVKERLR